MTGQFQQTLPGMAGLATKAKVSKERLPTNTTTYRHPIHRWFNFIAGFSPEFVGLCLDEIEDRSPDVLLDPFAGCATAPLVAWQRGMKVIGYEPHPVLFRIACAKFPNGNALARVKKIESAILTGLESPQPVTRLPESPATFLTKLFPQPALEQLLGAKCGLKEASLLEDDLAFLILSKILDKCSHSQTDGIYKAPESKKQATAPAKATQDVLDMVYSDLRECSPRPSSRSSRIYSKSSQHMSEVRENSVDIVVTSPPYLNNFDFAEMTRMSLYFWDMAESWGDITKKVRSRLIVNTTTALKGHKERQDEYRGNVTDVILRELDELVVLLREQRGKRAGKKEYDYLVYPYFSQVTDVLQECYRCMRTDAPIHIMVADAALYGVHISTPQLITTIMEEIGFSDCECGFVRRRGHRWILDKRDGSKKGLGEYHVRACK